MSASAAATPMAKPLTDELGHPLTEHLLPGMVALLAEMAVGKEVHAFVHNHGTRPGHPANGYQLAAGSFEPSQFRDEIIVAAHDPYVAQTDPQNSIYYDNFRAKDGWTYGVLPGHSVSFTRRDGMQITYVFVQPYSPPVSESAA